MSPFLKEAVYEEVRVLYSDKLKKQDHLQADMNSAHCPCTK